MYAKTTEDANAALKSILSLNEKHPAFIHRFLKFSQRKKEWMLLFRLDACTRNHNTNNFAEASIRVLKDTVLQRIKANNVVALCDYLVTMFDTYLVKRLLEYAYNRNSKGKIIYKSFNEQIDKTLAENIIDASDNVYYVPSSTNPNQYYEVHADVGVCSCFSGLTGAFCKHQWLLKDARKIHLPNMPLVTSEDRHLLGLLALGDNCPQKSFFADFNQQGMETSINNEIDTTLDIIQGQHQTLTSTTQNCTIEMPSTSQPATHNQTNTHTNFASPTYKKLLLTQMETLLENYIPLNTAHTIENFLKAIKFKLSRKHHNRTGKKIKVQPTSIARRGLGVSRGYYKLPQGHPITKTNFSFFKRKRHLSSNIQLNQNNPK